MGCLPPNARVGGLLFDLVQQEEQKPYSWLRKNQVALEYIVGDLSSFILKRASFDAVALIYAHFAAGKRSVFHSKLDNALKPGGILIIEAFSKKHLLLNSLDPAVGGTKDIDMLLSKEEILADFEKL